MAGRRRLAVYHVYLRCVYLFVLRGGQVYNFLACIRDTYFSDTLDDGVFFPAYERNIQKKKLYKDNKDLAERDLYNPFGGISLMHILQQGISVFALLLLRDRSDVIPCIQRACRYRRPPVYKNRRFGELPQNGIYRRAVQYQQPQRIFA